MLSIEDLSIEFASLFSEEDSNKSVLVAGQALALWGMYYLGPSTPLDQLSPLASRDIDFYNARTSDVKKYAVLVVDYLRANNLRLEQSYPTPDSHTNNVGLWQVIENGSGESVVVDFIDYICGIDSVEMENPKNIDKMTIENNTFHILSPTMCMKARISNLITLYPFTKSAEKTANEKERVKLAIRIVHQHLLDISMGDLRHAYKRAAQVLDIAKSSLGKRLYKQEGISVLDAIPKSTFSEKFYSYCLKDAKQKMEGKALHSGNTLVM